MTDSIDSGVSPDEDEPLRTDVVLDDPLEHYVPPFRLLSDMIFVAAVCPTKPLQRAFPEQRFLSLFGKTPLVMWFSRVKTIHYHDAQGKVRVMGGQNAALYNELNVVALLRERAFFVPDILATSDLTIRIGRRYGMPKRPTEMRFQVEKRAIESEVRDGLWHAPLQARLVTPGVVLGALLSRLWPLRVWPARFPSGSAIRARILETPKGQVATVRGALALDKSWLSVPLPLLPLGLYAPDLWMELPPPEADDGQ